MPEILTAAPDHPTHHVHPDFEKPPTIFGPDSWSVASQSSPRGGAPCGGGVLLGVEFVAPGDPFAEEAEVVVRARRRDGEQAGADVEHRLADLLGGLAADAGGALDLTRVAAQRAAVLVEYGVLVRQRLGVAEAVPDVRVLGDQLQRLLLTAAADQHRDVPGRRRVQLGPALLDPRPRLAEGVQPAARSTELVAVLVVVLLEPAGSDAEDQPAVTDVVDRARHVGEQVGVAVGVAGDQRAYLDPLGGLGPGSQHGPALEVQALGLPAERVEVVPV